MKKKKLTIQDMYDIAGQGCIITYTGQAFNLLNPSQETINIEDIAHSLSRQVRWNGHTRVFWTVAQHSMQMAVDMKQDGYGPDECLQALLHDSAEAYVGDMAKPLKNLIPKFSEIEDNILDVIFETFNVIKTMHPDIKGFYDKMALENEWDGVVMSENWPTESMNNVKTNFIEMFIRINTWRNELKTQTYDHTNLP